MSTAGRWSLFRREALPAPDAEFIARRLLRRTGVVFRKTLQREKQPFPGATWPATCRALEARGEIRGRPLRGRLQRGAVRAARGGRPAPGGAEAPASCEPVTVAAADPLNFRGILTPDDRVPALAKQRVQVG